MKQCECGLFSCFNHPLLGLFISHEEDALRNRLGLNRHSRDSFVELTVDIAKMTNEAQEGIDINTDGNVISDYVHPHAVNAGIPVEEIRPPTGGKEFEVDDLVLEGKR